MWGARWGSCRWPLVSYDHVNRNGSEGSNRFQRLYHEQLNQNRVLDVALDHTYAFMHMPQPSLPTRAPAVGRGGALCSLLARLHLLRLRFYPCAFFHFMLRFCFRSRIKSEARTCAFFQLRLPPLAPSSTRGALPLPLPLVALLPFRLLPLAPCCPCGAFTLPPSAAALYPSAFHLWRFTLRPSTCGALPFGLPLVALLPFGLPLAALLI